MSRIARSVAVALVAAVGFTAVPADAAKRSGAINKIYRDCSDGKINNKKHKLKNLKKAKRRLPADLKQYTGCTKALKKEIRRKQRRR